MSAKIEYWDEDFETKMSDREYDEIGTLTIEVSRGWGSGYDKKHTDIYLDPATGLVLGDVAAYERWIA